MAVPAPAPAVLGEPAESAAVSGLVGGATGVCPPGRLAAFTGGGYQHASRARPAQTLPVSGPTHRARISRQQLILSVGRALPVEVEPELLELVLGGEGPRLPCLRGTE